MTRVVWSDRAQNVVHDIIGYIRQHDSIAAEWVGARLFALGESLATFPHRGRSASGEARELPTVWPYLLRYRVVKGVVLIVRVRHGRRRPLR